MNIQEIENAGRSIEEQRVKIQTLGEQRGNVFFMLKENEIVLEELKTMDDTDVVMKLVGSTLIKNDLVEAKNTVKQRIEGFNNSLKQLEKGLEEAQQELVKREETLRKLTQQR